MYINILHFVKLGSMKRLSLFSHWRKVLLEFMTFSPSAEGNSVVQPLSCIQLFASPWTIAHQAPLSMGFFRQEYWSGCHFLLQGIFPTQGLNPCLLCTARWILYHWVTWEAHLTIRSIYKSRIGIILIILLWTRIY